MGYAEAENAQELIEGFAEECKKNHIPCDLLHFSSGYTVDPFNGARNVFTWNNGRFPNPSKMFKKLRQAGIKTVANVKPWLLSRHPSYAKVAAERGFVWDDTIPSTTRLWSAGAGSTATGSYIDFSSPAGRKFWKEGVKALLDVGVDGIWNDNNEFSLHDDEHTFDLNGKPLTVGQVGRAYQTVLMASASYEAMVESRPTSRPFLITRSCAPGGQKYASQTWSGI
jgi:alpha-glucosidase